MEFPLITVSGKEEKLLQKIYTEFYASLNQRASIEYIHMNYARFQA